MIYEGCPVLSAVKMRLEDAGESEIDMNVAGLVQWGVLMFPWRHTLIEPL